MAGGRPGQSALRGRRRQAVRISVMCSVPLSGSQTSPARPRIWRTAAPSFGSAMRVNFSLLASKLKIALLAKSLSQTLSRSST